MRRLYRNVRHLNPDLIRLGKFDLLDLEVETAWQGIKESMDREGAVPMVIRIEVYAEVEVPQ